VTKILAIETSCDETAAAVIANGREIQSNVVATQIELHRRFGGVFPEVASRQHVLTIYPVIQQALDEAGIIAPAQLNAIAVTHGPGLAGSLLVGVNVAKGMAFGSGLPLISINHLEGHIYSNWLRTDATPGVPDDPFPLLVLIVSGGHTELVLMTDHGQYTRLGSTLDDAAGEAFDKVARLLHLGFPGGPAIQRAAETGDAARFNLPRPLLGNVAHRFNFSFSGLKTAVLNIVRALEQAASTPAQVPIQTDESPPSWAADMAASFQVAVADVLTAKLVDAARHHRVRHVCICGGVSANRSLRELAAARLAEQNIPLTIPPLAFCTDNAAMIGAAAYFRLQTDPQAVSNLQLDVYASLPLGDVAR
jgi:N6-L-threonylcarbamoyladenine synthase